MHGEALLMTLQTLGLAPPPLPATDPPSGKPSGVRDIKFKGGRFMQGARSGGRDFVFDNEKEAHEVRVEAFAIADRTLTQGEFAAFVDEGGYERDEFWTTEGLRWRVAEAARMPRYWRDSGGKRQARRFDAWHDLDPCAPMIHVTAHEASAWCRWAGRRLPTESEWEFAARNAGNDDRFPWGDQRAGGAKALDLRYRGPSHAFADPAPSRSGLKLMLGGVWEWTSSPFEPYSGFRPDPYKEYSEPWFHTHQVLRGGCFATRSRLVHNRWRNFYLPERGDVFAGFRTCALEG
jgi:iron(II)-dependent oxidoreductase